MFFFNQPKFVTILPVFTLKDYFRKTKGVTNTNFPHCSKGPARPEHWPDPAHKGKGTCEVHIHVTQVSGSKACEKLNYYAG